MATLFNIGDASRLVFTCNVTESLNLAIKGLVCPGDHVVTTAMEHNAVWRCLRVLEVEGVISLSAVPCREDGTLVVEQLPAMLQPNTSLIVMFHASNVLGTLVPMKEVGAIARHGIPFLVVRRRRREPTPWMWRNVPLTFWPSLDIRALEVCRHRGLYIRPGLELKPLKEGGRE